MTCQTLEAREKVKQEALRVASQPLRSFSSIQLKLIKIGAKIIRHSRMTIFQMAEVTVPEKLFRTMLLRIHRLGRACARAPALSL